MDEIQEYPKALYKDGAYSQVEDAEAEKAARKKGWRDWTEDQERMQRLAEAATDAPNPEA
jgi:hypothetical protein